MAGVTAVDEMVQVFDKGFLDALSEAARASPRLRQHHNIHVSYDDPCQRFLNAMEPSSYLRPHRHASVPRTKLLTALRGKFALVLFNDAGTVTRVALLGGSASPGFSNAAEVAPNCWNTVLSLEPGSVLLEVKQGPFDPTGPRDIAPWSPEEGTEAAHAFVQRIQASAVDLATDAKGGVAS